MKKIQNIPAMDRPREKLRALGPAALSDLELLAALIGSGIKGKHVLSLSRSVLSLFEEDQAHLNFNRLTAIAGIGSAKACQLLAALEFARRRTQAQSLAIKNATDALPHLNHIAVKPQENFMCLSLNGANEIIAGRLITIGLLNATQIHPREVFADVICDRAAAVIIAHNHPSGLLEPSADDLAVTQRLVEAGKILGIALLDHIILTKKGYFSFKDNGLI